VDTNSLVIRRRGGDQNIPRPEQWRPGSEPAWFSRDLSILHDIDAMHERLSHHVAQPRQKSSDLSHEWVSTSRASAVLMPLYETDAGPSVLLTRRADHLRNHRGEISFPGGRMESGEEPHHTALREAHEEVSLHPDHVSVIGQLDPIATFVSNSYITPVVARVNTVSNLRADPGEVARILSTPLHELVREDTYRNEWWTTPRGEINIHFFELDDETVWGATGRLLHQLIDAVTTPL
jgi:8-oxo-dGTP pyrophosphatase MutT (NUDIX family)